MAHAVNFIMPVFVLDMRAAPCLNARNLFSEQIEI